MLFLPLEAQIIDIGLYVNWGQRIRAIALTESRFWGIFFTAPGSCRCLVQAFSLSAMPATVSQQTEHKGFVLRHFSGQGLSNRLWGGI